MSDADWEYREEDFKLITTAWGQLTSEQVRLVVENANARLRAERAKCQVVYGLWNDKHDAMVLGTNPPKFAPYEFTARLDGIREIK